MIGRGAAIAEVGRHRHELHGVIAFSAWLGVHAALMTGVRTRIDAFVTWASVIRRMPERKVCRLINTLLDLCPVLADFPEVKKSFYCSYIAPRPSDEALSPTDAG